MAQFCSSHSPVTSCQHPRPRPRSGQRQGFYSLFQPLTAASCHTPVGKGLSDEAFACLMLMALRSRSCQFSRDAGVLLRGVLAASPSTNEGFAPAVLTGARGCSGVSGSPPRGRLQVQTLILQGGRLPRAAVCSEPGVWIWARLQQTKSLPCLSADFFFSGFFFVSRVVN